MALYLGVDKICLDFSLKCIKHTKNGRIFPQNPSTSEHFIQHKEIFQVNFGRTDDYKNSAVPFCQRLLNNYFTGK
jgi:hypothetical protein